MFNTCLSNCWSSCFSILVHFVRYPLVPRHLVRLGTTMPRHLTIFNNTYVNCLHSCIYFVDGDTFFNPARIVRCMRALQHRARQALMDRWLVWQRRHVRVTALRVRGVHVGDIYVQHLFTFKFFCVFSRLLLPIWKCHRDRKHLPYWVCIFIAIYVQCFA